MRRVVAILVLAVLLASCSGAGERADTTTTPGPVTTQAAAGGEIEGSFDVGGHKLHLRCEGKGSPGSPTVVYLHGLGGDGSDVESISAPLASRGRVCSYDRVNVGGSDSDAGRHTGADSVRDLRALLDAAGVAGPYLLVGFSFGGLLSLDGSLPTDDEVDRLIPKDARAQAIAEQEANRERVEFYRTVDEAKPLVARVPDVPVTYMAARPVEVRSSHDIDLEQPQLVIKEIDRILETA